MEVNEEKNTRKSKQNFHEDWKNLVAGYSTIFLRELSGGIIKKIRDAIHSAVVGFVRSLAGLLVALTGLVFLALGVVHFLAEAMGSLWSGYVVVGAVFLLIGLILTSVGKGKCC